MTWGLLIIGPPDYSFDHPEHATDPERRAQRRPLVSGSRRGAARSGGRAALVSDSRLRLSSARAMTIFHRALFCPPKDWRFSACSSASVTCGGGGGGGGHGRGGGVAVGCVWKSDSGETGTGTGMGG